MIDPNKILRVLRTELTLQTRHHRVLEQQRQALTDCDRTRFIALQAEHAELLAEMEAHGEARRETLQGQDGAALTVTQVIELAPDRLRQPLEAVGDALQTLLERNRTLSRTNQALIQNELDYIAFSLDLFVEAGRRAESAYGGGYAGRGFLNWRA